MKTVINHRFNRLDMAPHVEHLGNGLRNQSPRCQFNEAFADCLLHDARLAHELVDALKTITTALEDHPDALRGNSKVHFAWITARGAVANAEKTETA